MSVQISKRSKPGNKLHKSLGASTKIPSPNTNLILSKKKIHSPFRFNSRINKKFRFCEKISHLRLKTSNTNTSKQSELIHKICYESLAIFFPSATFNGKPFPRPPNKTINSEFPTRIYDNYVALKRNLLTD